METSGTEGPDRLDGTNGADVINGFGDDDVINGLGGDDRLNGGHGDDILHGGDGDDELVDDHSGADELYGEGGNDRITVAFESHTAAPRRLVDGGAGNDIITIGKGAVAVTALGGEGDDSFFLSSTHAQRLTGGAGQDYFQFSGAFQSTITDFQAGPAGDRLNVAPFVDLVTRWNGVGDPFALGYAALTASADGATLWFDADGGADSLVPFLFLTGVDPFALVPDNFAGGSAVRIVPGAPAGEVLQGGLQNDRFAGGGSNLIEGGRGLDAVDYSGALEDYQTAYADGSWYVLQRDAAGGYTMVDRLDEIERARFADGTFAFDAMAIERTLSQPDYARVGTVAAAPGGGFVLSWGGPDTTYFRFYDETGMPVGAARPAFDGMAFGSSRIAFLADGGFAIVAAAYDGDRDGLIGRVFDADGTARGPGFIVNSLIEGDQRYPSIAPLADGSFVVGWGNFETAARARHFSALGAPIGEEFGLGSLATPAFGRVALAPLAGGGFVALTMSGTDAYVRQYDSAAQPVGAAVKVNEATISLYSGLAAAALPHGEVLLVWEDGYGVSSRTFDPASGALGPLAAVSTTRGATVPAIAVFDDGSYVIAWEQSLSERKTLAQRFDSSGNRIGDEFTVSVGEFQPQPQIAALAGGSFVAAWEGGSFSPFAIDVQMAILAGPSMRDLGSGDAIVPTAGLAATAGREGADVLAGTGGDDLIDGRGGADRLLAAAGGRDVVLGGAGNDILYFGGAFTAADAALGGDGTDTLVLQGDYKALTLGAFSVTGIEGISLQSGSVTRWGQDGTASYDYDLTMASANVAPGQQLRVNAQSLRAGEDFAFDGASETDGGRFLVYAGFGTDDLTGGAGNDIFFFEAGRLGAGDRVNGGGGNDAVVLSGAPAGSGALAATIAAGMLTGIESLSVNGRFASDPMARPSYQLTIENGNIAPGGRLIVNGSSLDGTQILRVDAGAVADGFLWLFGGAYADTLVGGGNDDLIHGGTGSDALRGGGGVDLFQYRGVLESTPAAQDRIYDFEHGSDRIDLSLVDANSMAAGDQAFTFFAGGTFSGAPGELRAFHYPGEGLWRAYGDIDGDGVGDFMVEVIVEAGQPLTAGDFIL